MTTDKVQITLKGDDAKRFSIFKKYLIKQAKKQNIWDSTNNGAVDVKPEQIDDAMVIALLIEQYEFSCDVTVDIDQGFVIDGECSDEEEET